MRQLYRKSHLHRDVKSCKGEILCVGGGKAPPGPPPTGSRAYAPLTNRASFTITHVFAGAIPDPPAASRNSPAGTVARGSELLSRPPGRCSSRPGAVLPARALFFLSPRPRSTT